MKVDFIAYHDLQAQAGESIYEEMSHFFDCKWCIGPAQRPSGASVALMLDHTGFHPEINKKCYKHLFHLSHDLGDTDVYTHEKRSLKNYDIIFVPSAIQYDAAKAQLGKKCIVLQTGWAKYDKMHFSNEHREVEKSIERLPHSFTIMYAPTFAWTHEWEYLLPILKKLPCNIIIKNHIYINNGQPYPKGQEFEYQKHLDSAAQMERFAIEGSPKNVMIAPRNLNICSLFPYVNVLISDQSSVLLEYAPFGISVETGRTDPNENNVIPQISLMSKEVFFFYRMKISEVFSSIDRLNNFLTRVEPKQVPNVRETHAGKLTTYLICKYIEELGGQHIKSKGNFIHSWFLSFGKRHLESRMLGWKDLFLSRKSDVYPQPFVQDK